MKKNGLDIIHGTCVYMNGAGILLRGRSGTGKSDLALRLINDGAQLVADDQVALQIAHGNLLASAPSSLKGLLEIRGVGIIKVCSRTSAAVRLIVDLVGEKEVKRLPESKRAYLAGIDLPTTELYAFEASAVAKVRIALDLALSKLLRAND